MMLSPRENFLRALRRDAPQWVPFDLSLSPALLSELERRTGFADAYEYFGIPLAGIPVSPSRAVADYGRYFPHGLPPRTAIDEWGIAHRQGGLAHFEEMLHPMLTTSPPNAI